MGNRLTLAVLLLATLLPSVTSTQEARSAISLRMLEPSFGARRLTIMEGERELGSIAIPSDVPPAAVDAALPRALRHPNGRDIAVAFDGLEASFVVVFLRQAAGTYRAVDVSRVERVNIGGIGPWATYTARHTEPVEWLPLDRIAASGHPFDGTEAVQIRFRTRVWDANGVRKSMSEPLIVTRDGIALWR